LKKNKEILIATSNQGKVKEFNKLFKNHKLYSLSDLNIEDAVEDGSSFLENAIIKAKHGALKSGKYTIADDSGLVVPGLNFEPGIYSARYAGANASDKDNRDKIINKLNTLGLDNLDAYYVCILVGLKNFDDPMPIISQGEIHGRVSLISSGDGGFGYDKIFYPSDCDCSMASINPDIKNNISHRAIASSKFLQKYNSF
jgi:XTP/dITP diphosphohydrolase